MGGDFSAFMRACQARVERALRRYMPTTDTAPAKLHAAMRYGALDGGKRVRPMLVYAAGQAVGAAQATLDAPACAVEMIHVYSLIHDDLPAMDDDDLRRGRPTCHKQYDEATAILAGDALQPLAYQIITQEGRLSAQSRLRMIETLSAAAGCLGLVGGQVMDLQAQGEALDVSALEAMHAKKTGALICAAARLGALGAEAVDEAALAGLDEYGRCIGLAFQIQDDILDEVGDTRTLGKPQGSDRRQDKSTFVSLCGVEASRRRAEELMRQASAALEAVRGDTSRLAELGRYITRRDY